MHVQDGTSADSDFSEGGSDGSEHLLSPPSVNLPKGGGAIQGIDEKLSVNPATGTAGLTIPIPVSPGRSGFQPQLRISYDSGNGNGPFGLGWSLSLPRVSRKTAKGLPQYLGDDTYLLSGAEDLVPALEETEKGEWVPVTGGSEEDRRQYEILRYRPRVEGMFARIERWEHRSTKDVHWRSVTKDNTTTIYGASAAARIADPEDRTRIFSWLIEETRDDRGNVIRYSYAEEDAEGVDPGNLHERNRLGRPSAFTNRYLKRVRYGNRRLDPSVDADWMFDVVFDYGEHDDDAPRVEPGDRLWGVRPDPFSSYRSGFEIRTYRRCRRVLVFHRFPELGEAPHLVRALEFEYGGSDDPRFPQYSYLQRVRTRGFRWDAASERYAHRAMPPLEFDYQTARLQEKTPAKIESQVLEDQVGTLLHRGGQWADLDGEGLPGVLSEQGGHWYFRRNFGEGAFGAAEVVNPAPAPVTVAGGREQLLDLAGDGQQDLVVLGETSGFYERRREGNWQTFRALEKSPNLAWGQPNLRFIDLDGDGLSDAMLTEDQAFVWYRSLGEQGFEPARRVNQALDEEKGPTLVFADPTESVYLADLSGDGLTDLVRIRNHEICYWPNMGHGRFGAKVTMDGAPVFDRPDQFDQSRVHLVDIDGSGSTDVLYVRADSVDIWFNQSGNRWGERLRLENLPTADDTTRVTAVDFLGRGTAQLVWSSPLPGDANHPTKYLDLVGKKKPHLLSRIRDNMGAETFIEYKPSTDYYLADRAAGRPWITRLPFPVQVAAKVTKRDCITGNRLITTYNYHHGYFDGLEREFRGFGRVEQFDAETITRTEAGASDRSVPSGAETFDLPPVRTVTWFHTGAYMDRHRVARLYADEYYGSDQEAQDPDAALLPDTVLPAGLTAEEEREAARALKGRALRQEVYADDGSAERKHPYTVTETNFNLRRIQPRAGQRHAVFHAYKRQSLAYHYERHKDDPRLVQSINLEVDLFGNVTDALSIAYPRRISRIPEQEHALVTYTQADFINKPNEASFYRIGLPSETRTYEITGLRGGHDREVEAERLDPRRPMMAEDDIRNLAEAINHAEAGIPYEQTPSGEAIRRRLIECQRVIYQKDSLDGPLAHNQIESLAIPWQTYQLVFTQGLVQAVYGDRLSDATDGDEGYSVLSKAGYVQFSEDGDGAWWSPSGRRQYAPPEDELPSGMPPESYARDRFYLPIAFIDPFGNVTQVKHDQHLLLTEAVEDPLGNRVQAENDYRTLKPRQITDPNDNRSRVAFDALGFVVASAVMGKPDGEETGDRVDNIIADLDPEATSDLLDSEDPESGAHDLLQEATTRLVYDLTRYYESRNDPQPQPNVVWTISRETHVRDLPAGERSRLQHLLLYSDGFGREILSKARAEPGPTPARRPETGELALRADDQGVLWTNQVDWADDSTDPRWIGTGRTVYDNKGNAIKKYEPFFSDTHRYEDEAKLVHWGVTPILRYDPLGRVIRTDNPDGTLSRVEFDPWRQETWDESDTVLESDWYDAPGRASPGRDLARLPAEPERRAAALAAEHAETPTDVHFDVLGRPVLSVAHNREVRRNRAGEITEIREQRIPTRTELDIEGQPLLIRDGRHIEDAADTDPLTYTGGNPVMEYRLRRDGPGTEVIAPGYDLAGRQLYQRSMDAGERRTLPDVVGSPLRTWDSRGHRLRYNYDALRRRTHLFVRDADGDEILAERTVYGESLGDDEERRSRNLSGQIYLQCDGAGLIENEAFDFKGNLLRSTRSLAREYKQTVDWNGADWDAVDAALDADSFVRDEVHGAFGPLLEPESFTESTTYDALSRPIESTTPDDSVTRTAYNEAGLLEALDVRVRGADVWTPFVRNIDYNEKGQRTAIEYGNDVITEYEYDATTFRLRWLHSTRDRAPRRVQDLTYTYDPVGNITEIRDDAQQTVYFGNSEIGPSNRYIYDALYRLIRAQGREHAVQNNLQRDNRDFKPLPGIPFPNSPEALQRYTEEYRYDSVGNIEVMRHTGGSALRWNRRYRYAEDSNRLLGTSLPGDEEDEFSSVYTYNVHGSMRTMPHLPEIAWDFKEQMQEADLDGGGRVYFTYDVSGQRVRKVHEHNGATLDERIYLSGYEIYRRRVGGDLRLERETLHVMDDQQRIALVETKTQGDGDRIENPSPVSRYQLSNHLGSASVEVDDGSRVISYEEYHPYGTTSFHSMRSATGLSLKRYRYTGKERDEETGLNYHTARYHANWLGRWSSTDRKQLSPSVNLYEYSYSNPTNFNDPTGLDPVLEESGFDPETGTSGGERPPLPEPQIDAVTGAPRPAPNGRVRPRNSQPTAEGENITITAIDISSLTEEERAAMKRLREAGVAERDIRLQIATMRSTFNPQSRQIDETAKKLQDAPERLLVFTATGVSVGAALGAGAAGVGALGGVEGTKNVVVALHAEVIFGNSLKIQAVIFFVGAVAGAAAPEGLPPPSIPGSAPNNMGRVAEAFDIGGLLNKLSQGLAEKLDDLIVDGAADTNEEAESRDAAEGRSQHAHVSESSRADAPRDDAARAGVRRPGGQAERGRKKPSQEKSVPERIRQLEVRVRRLEKRIERLR